jgi:peptidoglycan/xylan/chitin deacetylase (PgdA/CDA1 family)
MAGALILTYHAIEAGPAPLCTDPRRFEAQVDAVVESGAEVVTVRDLAERLRSGTLGEASTVVLTFDDGFTSVAETAAPLLRARNLPATVFCVAGHLGGSSDWETARNGGFRSRIASAEALRRLAAAGFELGSHGVDHSPLADASGPTLRREIVESRTALEDLLETQVTSFAYPYGAVPDRAGRELVAETYRAACTTVLGRIPAAGDPLRLARVDAHYLRDPDRLARALRGELGGYLFARGVAARARRTIVKDYARAAGRDGGLTE